MKICAVYAVGVLGLMIAGCADQTTIAVLDGCCLADIQTH